MDEEEFFEEWNHFLSRINYNKSAFDAKAIQFMNEFPEKLKDTKFDIWLVWDNDITKNELYLRAVTFTKERAERYKKDIEKTHKDFNKKFYVEIEGRTLNHLMGEVALQRIKELRI